MQGISLLSEKYAHPFSFSFPKRLNYGVLQRIARCHSTVYCVAECAQSLLHVYLSLFNHTAESDGNLSHATPPLLQTLSVLANFLEMAFFCSL